MYPPYNKKYKIGPLKPTNVLLGNKVGVNFVKLN